MLLQPHVSLLTQDLCIHVHDYVQPRVRNDIHSNYTPHVGRGLRILVKAGPLTSR